MVEPTSHHLVDRALEGRIGEQRALLDRLVALAATIDRDGEDHATAATLRRHVDDRFLLVIVGEVKSGKSSFINALLGRSVCAVGPTPLTDKVQVLQFGERAGERLVEEFLLERDVDVELLREVSIVDTPGTNSILHEHSAITERFVPRADLILFLTSIDRPFSESEDRFLALIAGRWRKKVVFLVTKVDGRDPRDVRVVVEWVRKSVLERHRFEPPILPVSARLELEGSDGGFDAVRELVRRTLAAGEKMRLKLESPIGSAESLLGSLGERVAERGRVLDEDHRAVQDLDRQVEQAARDLKERAHIHLTELHGVFADAEQRAREFFDRHARLKPLLLGGARGSLRQAFEREVLAEIENRYAATMQRALDWLMREEIDLHERSLRHLGERAQPGSAGRVLPAGPARFEYRREEVVERLLESFRQERAALMAADGSEAFVAEAKRGMRRQLALTASAVGVGGVALFANLTLPWLNVAGLAVAVGLGLTGLAVLPAVRRRALRRFRERLDELAAQVRGAFVRAIGDEVDAARDRLRRGWEPFLLFHRTEAAELAERQREIRELRRSLAQFRRSVREA